MKQPLQVLAVLAIIVVGKSAIAFAIVVLLRSPVASALIVAASLAQIGEFSFILAELGIGLRLLPAEGQSLIVAGALLSIALNSFLMKAVSAIRRRMEPPVASLKSFWFLVAKRSGTLSPWRTRRDMEVQTPGRNTDPPRMMRRRAIKLVAMDVDGTLLDGDHQLRDAVKDSLYELVARNIHVVLATARGPQALNPVLHPLQFSPLLVCFSGAWVGEIDRQSLASKKVMLERRHSMSVARSIVATALDHNVEPHVLTVDTWRTRKMSPETMLECQLTECVRLSRRICWKMAWNRTKFF